jgi:hypothetical protein
MPLPVPWYLTAMFRGKTPQKPFLFLNLPKEIRLMVYEQLVDEVKYHLHYRNAQQFQQSTGRLFDKKIKRLTLHEPCCSLEVLGTCQTIYNEAKPTLERYLRSVKHHISCHGYSVLEMIELYMEMYDCKVCDYASCPDSKTFCLAKFSHLNKTVNLDIESSSHFLASSQKLLSRLRARPYGSTPLRVDYYPIPISMDADARQLLTQEASAQESALEQDLALLAYFKATEEIDLIVNVCHADRLLSLEEYDRSTNTPANFMSRISRQYWAAEFGNYRDNEGFCLGNSVLDLPEHWLLSRDLLPYPPRLPLLTTEWIILTATVVCYGILVPVLLFVYHSRQSISGPTFGIAYSAVAASSWWLAISGILMVFDRVPNIIQSSSRGAYALLALIFMTVLLFNLVGISVAKTLHVMM